MRNIYIIGRTCNVTGIGAILVGMTSHILYALDRGFTPIIDLKHYKNQYFKDGRTFKDNAWEYFFEQPCNIGLNDIKDDDNIIISENELFTKDEKYTLKVQKLPINKNSTDYLQELKLKYRSAFKFNKETLEYINNTYNKLIGDDKNVLGVLARGTDYLVRKSFGESVMPKPEEIIEKVKEYLKKYPDITKIYLATEDNTIYKKFKDEFGDRIIDNNQYRYDYDSKELQCLSEIDTGLKNHSYNIARDYLASLYILSKCKYFLGGRCTGTVIPYVMTDSWEDFYIWDLGFYGKPKNLLENIFSIKRCAGKTHEDLGITILWLKLRFRLKKLKR